MSDREKIILECLERNEITLEAVFVPFTQSRSKHDKQCSLNWKVTVISRGKRVLTTDYTAGAGHTPAYKLGVKNSTLREKMIAIECETGKPVDIDLHPIHGRKPIQINTCDVFYSLIMDTEVLNYSSFENWADEFGYDSDSIKALKVYEHCLSIALKLRNALSDNTFNELKLLFEDY
jgi:hypothetical protein